LGVAERANIGRMLLPLADVTKSGSKKALPLQKADWSQEAAGR
jgi:hypothetical protein